MDHHPFLELGAPVFQSTVGLEVLEIVGQILGFCP